ncbi:MAG: response regulator [Spirochaetes bacterium]|nr:response regulator [Spirochaetota bacterium]
MNNKILLVEDSASIRKSVGDLLVKDGYDVSFAENGKEGLDKVKAEYFQLVITDIEMPVMSGSVLIDNINGMEDPPVIIVMTSHSDSDMIIDIMKKGVFDYLIKPVKKNDMLLRIQNAFKISELNRMKKITEKEKNIRLEQQLDWYKLVDRMTRKEVHLKETNLFENLRRSLNQGSGIGVMVSLIDLISMTAKKKGDVYEISETIMNDIFKNQALVYKTMQVFFDIEKLTSEDLELERIPLNDLYEAVNTAINDLEESAAIGNHKLVLSERKKIFDRIAVNINAEYFKKIIDEMLINAMKYSEKGSTVFTIIDTRGGDVIFSVINNIKQDGDDGIPMEYENIVFEPFFRKIKYIQEEYNTLDYGLGLTLVERVVKKHNGKVMINNITDYSDIGRKPAIKVNCQVELPQAV